MRKNWREYEVTAAQAEEMEQAYIIFEEDPENNKSYDLSMGIFKDLEVAKEYAESIKQNEPLYIANYKDYADGSYNYLATI